MVLSLIIIHAASFHANLTLTPERHRAGIIKNPKEKGLTVEDKPIFQ